MKRRKPSLRARRESGSEKQENIEILLQDKAATSCFRVQGHTLEIRESRQSTWNNKIRNSEPTDNLKEDI